MLQLVECVWIVKYTSGYIKCDEQLRPDQAKTIKTAATAAEASLIGNARW